MNVQSHDYDYVLRSLITTVYLRLQFCMNEMLYNVPVLRLIEVMELTLLEILFLLFGSGLSCQMCWNVDLHNLVI